MVPVHCHSSTFSHKLHRGQKIISQSSHSEDCHANLSLHFSFFDSYLAAALEGKTTVERHCAIAVTPIQLKKGKMNNYMQLCNNKCVHTATL